MLYLLLILEIFSPVATQWAYKLYDEGTLSHLSNLNPSWDFLEPSPPTKRKRNQVSLKTGP